MSPHPDSRQFPSWELPGDSPSIVKVSPAPIPPRNLIDISHRLTPRDYALAGLLDQHSTLTTEQINRILFTNAITCRHRLQQLRRLGFVDRFPRNRPGNPGTLCWIPGPLSARYSAMVRGDNPPTASALRRRQDRIYVSPTLHHLLAVNDFFTALLTTARGRPDAGLLRWWSEKATAAAFAQKVRPDGHGVWAEHGRQTGFFLELDRGTEPLGKLVGKLKAQRRLLTDGGPHYPVLFVLPSAMREDNLHRKLAGQLGNGPIVATTSVNADPSGPVWRVAGYDRHRLPLIDLPSDHGQPGPLNPGPPAADDNPLTGLADLPAA